MNNKRIPEGYHSITPYLMTNDPKNYINFLLKAFNAKLTECLSNDENSTHSEVKIGDSMVMVGSRKGETVYPAKLYLYVENIDEVYRQVIEAGAISLTEPMDQYYGDRNASVKDPSGHEWWIATRINKLK